MVVSLASGNIVVDKCEQASGRFPSLLGILS
jgi:hypothetical protein